MGCTCGGKAIVWTCWALGTILGVLYCCLALSSAYHFNESSKNLQGDNISTYKNGFMAACVLGFFIVVFWIIWSFIVLISRLFRDVKVAYGLLLGATSHTAWFLLLAGLVVQTYEPTVEQFKAAPAGSKAHWSSTVFQAYQATYVFSYILVAAYVLLFFVFLLGRKHLGREDLAPPPPPPSNSLPSSSYVEFGKAQQV